MRITPTSIASGEAIPLRRLFLSDPRATHFVVGESYALHLELSKLLNFSTFFILKVRGSSMLEAGIRDGDLVILEYRVPRHNEVVAVMMNGTSTLMRFVQVDDREVLKQDAPFSTTSIAAKDVCIQGVFSALLRGGFAQ